MLVKGENEYFILCYLNSAVGYVLPFDFFLNNKLKVLGG